MINGMVLLIIHLSHADIWSQILRYSGNSFQLSSTVSPMVTMMMPLVFTQMVVPIGNANGNEDGKKDANDIHNSDL